MTSTKQPMIVIGGENLIDLVEDKSLDGAPAFRAVVGGGPFNVAKACGTLGQNSGYLTPLADDAFAPLFDTVLKASSVQSLLPKSKRPTALAVVKLNDSGHPAYQFYRETTADRDIDETKLNANWPDNGAIFYVGGLALTGGADADAWADFIARRRDSKVMTAVDVNVRPTFIDNRDTFLNRIDRILAVSDVIKMSDEDIAWIAPDRDPEAVMRDVIAKHKTPLALLTKGADGATAFFKGEEIFQSSYRGDIVIKDTVGAGDCFTAACLTFIADNGCDLTALSIDKIAQMLNRAAATAAFNCTFEGCRPPNPEELTAFMTKHST